MNQSFTSPTTFSSEGLVCPPAPRGRKPSITFDGEHVIMPLYFPSSCSILATDDSNTVKMKFDLANIIDRPEAYFTLHSRTANAGVATRKIPLEEFPAMPFSYPISTSQPDTVHPSSVTMPRTSSDQSKLQPLPSRKSSIEQIEGWRNSYNARCA